MEQFEERSEGCSRCGAAEMRCDCEANRGASQDRGQEEEEDEEEEDEDKDRLLGKGHFETRPKVGFHYF